MPSQNLELVSDPPFESLGKGDTYSITTTYDLNQPISSGTVHNKVTLSGLKVTDETVDLCDSLSTLPAGGQCPLNPGTVSYTSDSAIKSSYPSGHYLATSTWHDDSGNEILCVETSLCL